MPTHFTAAGCTDVGRAREVNEDTFGVYTEQCFWLVADGMGGHASGEVASQMSVETLAEFFVAFGFEAGASGETRELKAAIQETYSTAAADPPA